MAGTQAPAGPSNTDLRVLLLGSARPSSQMVTPSTSYAPGNLISTNLPATGLANYVRVTASIQVTISGTVTASTKAPWNFFQSVRLQDYSGIDRVNCSPYILYLLSLLKKRSWDPAVSGDGITAPSYVAANRWSGMPTSAGNHTIVFSFEVPIALDSRDTRGTSLLSVPNGRWTLFLQCAPNLILDSSVNPTVDAPYTAAGGIPNTNNVVIQSGTTPTITLGYYFWEPRQLPGLKTPGGVPIPMGDLALIHEIRGQTVTSGIAPNQETLVTLNTGRDYYRYIQSVVENGALAIDHISQIRWLYNGNKPTLSEYLQAYLSRVREAHRDMPEGMLFYSMVNNPWDSNSYGSLQVGTTPNGSFSNAGNTYFEYLTEALYMAPPAAGQQA